uniref:Uncharacterized protein n=1 Tax=Mustela putorius furo TaxID=9669 RepID=M3Z7X1_MUSPF
MQGPHGTGTQENSMRPPPCKGPGPFSMATGQDRVEATPVSRTPASNAFLAQSLLPGGFGEGPAEHTADTHVRAPETNMGGGAQGTPQLPPPLLRAMPDPGSRGSQHVTLSAPKPTDGNCGVRWNLPGSRGEDCTPARGDRPHTQITTPEPPEKPRPQPLKRDSTCVCRCELYSDSARWGSPNPDDRVLVRRGRDRSTGRPGADQGQVVSIHQRQTGLAHTCVWNFLLPECEQILCCLSPTCGLWGPKTLRPRPLELIPEASVLRGGHCIPAGWTLALQEAGAPRVAPTALGEKGHSLPRSHTHLHPQPVTTWGRAAGRAVGMQVCLLTVKHELGTHSRPGDSPLPAGPCSLAGRPAHLQEGDDAVTGDRLQQARCPREALQAGPAGREEGADDDDPGGRPGQHANDQLPLQGLPKPTGGQTFRYQPKT